MKPNFLIVFLALATLGTYSQAQILKPVKWTYAAKKINDKEAVIFMKATIDKGWHIYSQTVKEDGPVKTSFSFSPSKDYTTVGTPVEPKPITKYESAFKMNVAYFENSVIFQQKVKLLAGQTEVKGKLEFMTCNDKQCLSPEDIEFSVPVR